MLERLGATAPIVDAPSELEQCDGIILPGVGAFRDAMRKLDESGMSDGIREQVRVHRKPILGICLGMQLLARDSTESGQHLGLGLIDAVVRPLEVKSHRDWAGRKLTLPHIGWNSVTARSDSRLFAGIPPASDFYFVHSYHAICEDNDTAAARSTYGDEFVSAIDTENVFAAQFHPEKSQLHGQQLLRNFVELVAAETEAKLD